MVEVKKKKEDMNVYIESLLKLGREKTLHYAVSSSLVLLSIFNVTSFGVTATELLPYAYKYILLEY